MIRHLKHDISNGVERKGYHFSCLKKREVAPSVRKNRKLKLWSQEKAQDLFDIK